MRAFNFTAGAGEISTPDGGSIHFWGYHAPGANPAEVPQYPGPTLIVTEGDTVNINLTNYGVPQPVSIVVTGHNVTAGGGVPGLVTQAASVGQTVTYTFVANEPGTYLYQSATQPSLQVPMGLFGALIVDGYGTTPAPVDDVTLLFSEIDPVQNQRVADASGAATPVAEATR